MELVKVNNTTYKIVNGRAYHENTPDSVILILDNTYRHGTRIRLFYGNAESGMDWMEENDVLGTIGYSTGEVSVPLLIRTSRSYGGGAILDSNIVRITADKQDIYKHPSYYIPAYEIRPADFDIFTYEAINSDTYELIARFKTEQEAKRWDAYIQGWRNS